MTGAPAEADLTEYSCNPVPRWLARVRARFPGFSARYLELDPRSLGLARIYLGCLLLLEIARHVPVIDLFYTDDGLYTRAAARRGAPYLFSLFFAAPHFPQVALLFALCALVFTALALGFHTRVAHVLAFVCILSLHARTPLFEDGSETTMRLLVFWTMFLPMGTRFSLDARRKHRPGSSAPDPRWRGSPAETRPVVSLGALAVLLQLSVIYLFNALQKDGVTWREGSTIHYLLHQDRIVTWLGWKLRPYLTPQVGAALTWSALAIEFCLPLLILSAWKTKLTRRIAIALGVSLHAGIALLVNLGLFSAVMFGQYILLLSDRDFALLERSRLLQRTRKALATLRARVATRAPPPPATGADGAAMQRSPAKRRAPTPALRELAVLLCGVLLGYLLLRENAVVPQWMQPHGPNRALRMVFGYPRLFEGWSMFAPEAPTGDYHVFISAHTIDGRVVDPLNEIASRVGTVPLAAIPERLGMDDVFNDYIVNLTGRTELHRALRAWVFRYHERTGRPNDRITSFSLFAITDDSPPPGERAPRNVHRHRIFSARAPQ